MDLGNIILSALKNEINDNISISDDIKKLDFLIAEKLPWGAFKDIDTEIKKVELMAKYYILSVLRDDKVKRISTIKILKENYPNLLTLLHGFRKGYANHQKKCVSKKEESCKAANK